jgi:hypothetical protein
MEKKSMMNQNSQWKVLADLLIELQKRGEKIPADVMNDLRAAKTIINVLKADPTHIENKSRIDTYLRNVESYAILTAEKLGIIEECLKKLKQVEEGKDQERNGESTRFIPGVPRKKSWIRIQITGDNLQENVEKLVEESKLSHKMHKDGYMLVYGKEENIKIFVKNMAERFRGSRN